MSDFIVGVTGGVASGKTSVTRRFEALGVFVADADHAARAVVEPGSPGLAARQMTPQQKQMLVGLVDEYLTRVPADVAAERHRRLLEGAALDEVHFQWAGGTEPGQAHAYIVQGPSFLIEYAQNRNNAVGHVHTLWRDFTGDFGGEIVATR